MKKPWGALVQKQLCRLLVATVCMYNEWSASEKLKVTHV